MEFLHLETRQLFPRMHHRYPHELHWRKLPPDSKGSLDKTLVHLYPHLVDHVSCLQCGAIPCPHDHEEEARLRLKDLDFVKELAKERKELRIEVSQMNEELELFHQKQRDWQIEKRMLQEQIRQYEGLYKDWKRERGLMEAEIKRLRALNEQHLELLEDHKKDRQKLLLLTQQLEGLRVENQRLQMENEKFRKIVLEQAGDIEDLTKENTCINNDLAKVKAEVKVLHVRLDESNESLQKLRKELWDKEAQVQELETEVRRLEDDIKAKTKLFQAKELQSQTTIRELKDYILILHGNLANSQKDNSKLRKRIEELLLEVEKLKQQLANDTRFRHFVTIKREVNDLKDDNETLFQKVYQHEQENPLPVMKRSGHVTTTGSQVKSASIRMAAVKLHRPKSSRSLRDLSTI